jgi:DNA-binding transcriptional regulator GbsR (MarR family)
MVGVKLFNVMTEAAQSHERVITDPKVAAFLIDPVSSEHLSPFMTGEKSLAQAALELGISKSRMSYWVKKLLGFNLITIVRIEKQGKHNVSIYAASAEVFTVPLDVITTDPNKDVFESATFERTLKRSLVHFKHQNLKGRDIRYAKEHDNVLLELSPQQTKKFGVIDHWGRVKLTKAQANHFYEEMNKLFNTIMQEAENDKGKKYVFKLVLVEQWPQ